MSVFCRHSSFDMYSFACIRKQTKQNLKNQKQSKTKQNKTKNQNQPKTKQNKTKQKNKNKAKQKKKQLLK